MPRHCRDVATAMATSISTIAVKAISRQGRLFFVLFGSHQSAPETSSGVGATAWTRSFGLPRRIARRQLRRRLSLHKDLASPT
jgi:hypothetical protein